MPYRTFADEQGRSWEIWDVRPERAERRGGDRRAENTEPWDGPERRVEQERRKRAEPRLALMPPLNEGWLVFKSDDEKRRLAPIPPNWESFRGQQLRELWERAHVIVGRIDERSA